MSLIERLKTRLVEPDVVGCAIDGPERFTAHRAVLARKPLIRGVFVEFHHLFDRLDRALLSGDGDVIELGAGVFPVRETYPHVLATDVVDAPGLDRVLDAQSMDLPDASVRAFYLQNAFHHFPDPSRFFAELERTLMPGGGGIIIEPHDGALARAIYPRLFASERYDRTDPSWTYDASGPMTGANQALSYLIFDRDIARFRREHPRLDVVHRDALGNWVRYLASGGLNFRPVVPGPVQPLLGLAEAALRPLRSALALHRVIVLRRRPDAA